MKTNSAGSTYRKKTEAEVRHEDRASHHYSRQAESWDRSGADGFVTQWAHGMLGAKEAANARIEKQGGRETFCGLYADGRRVKAKTITTKYGQSWVLHDDETDLIAQRGKAFLPTGINSRILKKLGLREARELAPARATLTGNGAGGLSGAASVYVKIYRAGCKWGTDAQYLEEYTIDENGHTSPVMDSSEWPPKKSSPHKGGC